MLNLSKMSRWVTPLATGLLLLGAAQAQIEDGLVAYWSFDNTYDDPVGGFYGEPRGTEPVAFVAGQASFGDAIALNYNLLDPATTDQHVEIVGGSEDNLEFPFDATDPTSGIMSISAWFRVETFDLDWQCLISKGEGSNYRIARRGGGNPIAYAGGIGEPGEAAPAVNDGLWHHVVAITQQTGTELWIDGVMYEQSGPDPQLAQSDLPLLIGENPGARGREWVGDIDDVAIWSRALTSAEIGQLAAAPLGTVSGKMGDTDGDTMSDIYEIQHGLDPDVSNVGMDTDGDGVEDVAEFNAGTHPNNPDTDGDGLIDGVETGTGIMVSLADTGTDPSDEDTDNDGLLDGVENNTGTFISADNTGTNPLDSDTDNDGTGDGQEVADGTDPNRVEGVRTVGDGLLVNYPFDEVDQNDYITQPDVTGQHDGTYMGLSAWTTLTAGKLGNAIELYPEDFAYVEVGDSVDEFDREGQDVSISCWFRVDAFDTDWQCLTSKGEGTSYRIARRGTTDTIAYAGGVGEPAQAAPAVNDGQWHHVVAVTRTGIQTELWIDGVLVEVGGAPSITGNDLSLWIGDNPGATGRYWRGAVDDYAVWSRPLDPAEIAMIWNEGRGATIEDLMDVSPPTFNGLAMNFGADEPSGAGTGTLAAEDVAGAPGVAQPNWNNLTLLAGSASGLTADADGTPVSTTVGVEWNSNNTWASTGRGEENNGFAWFPDLALMTGYLDTSADSVATVTVSGLPGLFAQNGYDAYVYALGGVAGRGGGYRLVDAWTGAALTPWTLAQSPASPTEHAQVPTDDPAAWGEGTYMVFPGITATDVSVEASTMVDPLTGVDLGFGSTQRAPINAVQLVPSPTGPASSGKKVAWVSFHEADDTPHPNAAGVGLTMAPDILYTKTLRNAGYKVDRILTSATPDAELLSNYDLVIISRTAPSSNYQNAGATAWNSIQTPMLIMNGYILRSSRMGYTTGTSMPDSTGDVALTVNDPTHPVFAGIPLDANNTMFGPYAGIVTWDDGGAGIVQRGISVNSDPVAGNGTVLAVVATEGDPTVGGMVIGEWQAGATMGNSTADVLAGPRLVFLSGSREASGFTGGEAAAMYDLSPTGARMFLNAVAYMAAMEPPSEAVIGMPEIADGNITINWTGGGELYYSSDLVNWTATGDTDGSYTEPLEAGHRFYTVR